MSNGFTINSLSNRYEKMYTHLLKINKDSIATTALLNDLFVVSTLKIKNKIQLNNYSDLFNHINSNYPNLLFSTFDMVKQSLIVLEEMHIDLISLLRNEKNLNGFESVFGNTLERRINRRKTGSYYTPNDTTKYIGWNSIFIAILNKMSKTLLDKIYSSINISNNVEFVDKKLTFEEKIKIIKNTLSNNDLNNIKKIIMELKIIDPTCGSGAFNISAYECIKYLNEHLLNNSLDSSYYFKNVYGVDINQEAIMLAQARLIIKSIIDNNFNSTLVSALSNNYIVGDALGGSDKVISGKNGVDWTILGDFDCIIGNPPYVEVKNKNDYNHYASVKSGNLYAYAIERACNIAKKGSIVSFVVPLPLIATRRMNTIREYLESKSSIIYYATFADRPGCLFTGVHQRLTIFFANIGEGKCRRYTSSYMFWYRAERQHLFKSLDFIENNNDALPKIGTNIENSIYVKNKICDSSVISIANKEGKYPLYVSSRIGFWAKAFFEKPKSKEITVLNFDSDEKRRVVYCFIDSSLFYFLWILISDCWHVTQTDLRNIRFNYNNLTKTQINRLIKISRELSEDLEKNKVRINSKQTDYEYKHKFSKKIIDKIDDILCLNIGLDHNETKFIKNYTLKYRMNNVIESEE